MEAKHTKGPWTLKDNHIIGYPESNIAIAHLLSGVGQPAEANGKLMAAAPELADACYAVLQSWHAKKSNFYKAEPYYMKQIREALIKAGR